MRVSRYAKIFAVLALFGGEAAAQCGPPDEEHPAVRESLLVSSAWLAQRLRDTNVVILEVGHAGAGLVPARPHIPGARAVDVMAWAVGNHDLPSVATLVSLAEAAGISNHSRVVLYGDPMSTGWIYFALDRIGHGDRTSVLDGGLDAWREERRPTVTTLATARRGRFTARPFNDGTVDAAWMRSRLADARTVILDVRSADEYAGRMHEDLPRVGHLPGARHLDWAQTFIGASDAHLNGTPKLKSPAELRRLFRAAGVRTGVTPAVYCTVGLRASHMYFVLRYLGYEPRSYDGSMADWSPRADHPLVTGMNRGNP